MAKYPQIERLYQTVAHGLFYNNSALGYVECLEAIEELAIAVHATETDENVWYIGEHEEASLDTLIIGAFWFCSDYHGGQSSLEYRVLSRLSEIYQPGSSNGPEDDTGEQSTYEALEGLFAKWKDAASD